MPTSRVEALYSPIFSAQTSDEVILTADTCISSAGCTSTVQKLEISCLPPPTAPSGGSNMTAELECNRQQESPTQAKPASEAAEGVIISDSIRVEATSAIMEMKKAGVRLVDIYSAVKEKYGLPSGFTYSVLYIEGFDPLKYNPRRKRDKKRDKKGSVANTVTTKFKELKTVPQITKTKKRQPLPPRSPVTKRPAAVKAMQNLNHMLAQWNDDRASTNAVDVISQKPDPADENMVQDAYINSCARVDRVIEDAFDDCDGGESGDGYGILENAILEIRSLFSRDRTISDIYWYIFSKYGLSYEFVSCALAWCSFESMTTAPYMSPQIIWQPVPQQSPPATAVYPNRYMQAVVLNTSQGGVPMLVPMWSK